MPKQLTSLIIAGSMATLPLSVSANDADLSFYGSLRVMLEIAEHKDSADLKDGLSRIGFKASKQINDDIKAFARYEIGLDSTEASLDTNGRLAYAGLSGDFGTVQAGKMWSPFYNTIAWNTDTMYWLSAPAYYTIDADFRIDNSIMYSSPNFNGLQLSVLAQVEDDTNSDNIEQSQFAATYSVNNLTLGLAYVNDDDDIIGVSASYGMGDLRISASYMDKDNQGNGGDLIATYVMGPGTLNLGYSNYSPENGDSTDYLIAGYQYNLSPEAQLFLEFQARDGSTDSHTTELGFKFNF